MHKIYLISCLSLLILWSCSIDPLNRDPLNFEDAKPLNVQLKDSSFPDFSYAGYKKSEEPLPFISEKITIAPGNRNDRVAIQNAIDSLARLPLENGFRGAILLKKGEYFVDSTLTIKNSGIVLRGEGQGEHGTIIYSTNQAKEWAKPDSITAQHAFKMEDFVFIQVIGGSKRTPRKNKQSITKNLMVGNTQIPITDATPFKIGDLIQLTKTTNEKWINNINMSQFGWAPKDYQLEYRTFITDIDKEIGRAHV